MPALLLTLLALLTVPATAGAAERTIVEQRAPTPVKSYADIALFSLWQGDGYRLAVSRGGEAPELLPFPAQRTPFDGDIGPGPDGAPTVAVSTCARGRGCGIDLLRIGDQRPDRARSFPRLASPPSRPSLWRTRLAWVQDGRVRTRRVTDLPGTVSPRLPGIPRGGRVEELELHQHRIGLSTTVDDAGVCGTRQIRLVNIRRSRARVIASQVCGLNGQSWAGPSFSGGWLYFARYCAAEPVGCGRGNFGAFRYRLRDGRSQLARFGRNVTGFAAEPGGRAYEARNPDNECNRTDLPLAPCSVVEVSGLEYRPAKPPH